MGFHESDCRELDSHEPGFRELSFRGSGFRELSRRNMVFDHGSVSTPELAKVRDLAGARESVSVHELMSLLDDLND